MAVIYDLHASTAVYEQRVGGPRCAVRTPDDRIRCIFQAEHDGDHAAWEGVSLRSWAFTIEVASESKKSGHGPESGGSPPGGR